jgi:hypothetical protein
MAAAFARRVAALLVTQPRESTLLWAEQTLSPMRVGGGICTSRTALFATRSFDRALLQAAQARSSMREMAAASARRVTALLVTQAFDGALHRAAQSRSSMCAMAAATEHRMTALVVTQSFVSALLWAARHACQGTLVNACDGGSIRVPGDSIARHSLVR